MSYLDMFKSRLAIVVKYNGEVILAAKDAQEIGDVIGMHEAVFIVVRENDGMLRVMKSQDDELAVPGEVLNLEKMYEVAAEYAKAYTLRPRQKK